MEHLEFIKKLDELGISIRNTNVENKEKVIESPDKNNNVSINNFAVKYVRESCFYRTTALEQLIRNGIDIDEWKHSMHYDIVPENYEKFIEIIQDKIIRRSKGLDVLMTVYSQLRHEISKNL